MTARIDSASRLVTAAPKTVYRAFAEPGALERWLPPGNMTGTMLQFDFREGGSYRMRLSYAEPTQGPGKTSEAAESGQVLGVPAAAPGVGLGRARMACRGFLRRRHPHGGCAVPGRSVRWAGRISRLSRLCRACHGAPVLREGACRPDGAFRGGGLSSQGLPASPLNSGGLELESSVDGT